MSGPPRRWAAVAFSIVLLSPLAGIPGFGAWGVRLPLLVAAAAALLYDRSRGPALRPDPLGVAACALLAVQALSLLVAQTPEEGAPLLIVLFSGLAIFCHARSGRLPREFILSTAPVLISVLALAVSALGLLQAALGEEAVATLGNRNYAGTLSAMLLPASVAFALAPEPRRIRGLHAGAALLLGAYLVVTDSRAGLVAAGIGIGCASVAMAAKGVPRVLAPAALLLVALAAAPFVSRGLRPLSADRLSTMSVRWEAWESAGHMIGDRPWLGVGLGNFGAAYPPYRSSKEARLSHLHEKGRGYREVEDPHSSWVQVSVEAGPAGLLAFLAVAALGAREWVRRLRGASEPRDAALLAGLGAGAAAYFVGGFFNTLTMQPAHTALFWAFLGMVEGSAPTSPAAPAGRGTSIAFKSACGAAIFGLLGSGAIAWAERLFVSARSSDDPERRLALLREAVEVYPPFWRAHEVRADALLALGRFEEASREAERALRLRPNGAVAMNTRAVARIRAGERIEGEAILRRGLVEAPHCWLTHLNLGSLEYERRNFGEAERQYALAGWVAPGAPQLPYRRAETHLARDDVSSALPYLHAARALGYDVGAALRRDRPGRLGDPRLAEFFR